MTEADFDWRGKALGGLCRPLWRACRMALTALAWALGIAILATSAVPVAILQQSPNLQLGARRQATPAQATNQTIEELKREVSENPQNPELRAKLGALFSSLGDYEAASKEFRAALDLNPDQPSVHNALGVALAKLNRLEDALE